MSQRTAEAVPVPGAAVETRTFLRRGLLFVLIGLLLYLALYIAADQLVYQFAKRNRFYQVKTAAHEEYDFVILGASHAAVFDYEDMNARLEGMTRSRIVNLSIVGGGVTVNRLMLDYFSARHQTRSVVYFVDSFAFYSRDWNEERLNDTRLFDRAPFDWDLAWILLRAPASRSVALNYLSGFSKINNADRFKPDVTDDETTKFGTTFRPVKQIDEERINYLYPKNVDPSVFRHYLTEFEDMVSYLHSRNTRLVVVKPPVPARFYRLLPNEEQFDKTLKATLDRQGVVLYDFSLVANEEVFFYNSDHLNRQGVLNFYENYLKRVLVP